MKVFQKELNKKWLSSTLTPMVVLVFIPIVAAIWPLFRDQISFLQEMFENPVYKVIIGELGIQLIDSWFGFISLYIFSWLEMVIVFITIFLPSRIITTEYDKKTLDIMLSYPIPRWQFLLEKFGSYLFFNLIYPVGIFGITSLTALAFGEQLNYALLIYVSLGSWLIFFALGALTLLCSVVFLEAKRSLAVAGALIIGQYVLVRFGGIVEILEPFKYVSLFNYYNVSKIITEGIFPVWDYVILLSFGIIALLASLIIFQKREIIY